MTPKMRNDDLLWLPKFVSLTSAPFDQENVLRDSTLPFLIAMAGRLPRKRGRFRRESNTWRRTLLRFHIEDGRMGRTIRLTFALFILGLQSARAQTSGGTVPAPITAQPAAEYRRPELVAITWFPSARGGSTPRSQRVWRPDGTELDAEEVAWLYTELGGLDASWRPKNSLRPLILIFRIDDRANASQRLQSSMRRDHVVETSGSGYFSSKHFLAKSTLSPARSQLAEWPGDMDVEVRVPTAEPELVKRIEKAPPQSVEVAPGVRWYLDNAAGQPDMPAAVFEVDRNFAEPLHDYSATVLLKDGTPLRGNTVSYLEEIGGRRIETHASQPVNSANPIATIEFWRLKHRMERYEKVPVRLDLLPKEEGPVAK
jgi:hypothetical protein